MKTTTSFGSFLVALVAVEGVCAIPFRLENNPASSIQSSTTEKIPVLHDHYPSVAEFPHIARAQASQAAYPFKGFQPDLNPDPFRGLSETHTGNTPNTQAPAAEKAHPILARVQPSHLARPWDGVDFQTVDYEAETQKGGAQYHGPAMTLPLNKARAQPSQAAIPLNAVGDYTPINYESKTHKGGAQYHEPTMPLAFKEARALPVQAAHPLPDLTATHLRVTPEMTHERVMPIGPVLVKDSFAPDEKTLFSDGAKAEKRTFRTFPQGHGPVVPSAPFPEPELESIKSSLRRSAPVVPPINGNIGILPSDFSHLTQGVRQQFSGAQSVTSNVPAQVEARLVEVQGEQNQTKHRLAGTSESFVKPMDKVGQGSLSLCDQGLCD